MYLKLVPLEISVWKPGSEGPTVIKTGGHHLFHLASCQKKKSQHGRMYSIWAGTSVPPTIRPWDSWFLNAVTQTGLTSLASLALSLQVWPWICSSHFLSHWFTLDIVALCLHNHVNQPLTVTHFLFLCVSICPIDFAPPEYTENTFQNTLSGLMEKKKDSLSYLLMLILCNLWVTFTYFLLRFNNSLDSALLYFHPYI